MRKDIVIKNKPPKPDKKYSNLMIGKFINFLMRNGEKEIAAKILYLSFDKLSTHFDLKNDEEILKFFESIIEKISCDYELRKMKIGGASYQVPIITLSSRKQGIAMRLLIKHARILAKSSYVSGKKTRSGTSMDVALFKEIKNIKDNIGASIKSKDQLLKTVQANKAFMNLFNRKKRRHVK